MPPAVWRRRSLGWCAFFGALGVAALVFDLGWITWVVALVGAGGALGSFVSFWRRSSWPWVVSGALLLLLIGVLPLRLAYWMPEPGAEAVVDADASIVAVDEDLVVTAHDAEAGGAVLVGLRRSSGEQVWESVTDGVVAVTGPRILALQEDRLLAVDRATGEVDWSLHLDGFDVDDARLLTEDRALLETGYGQHFLLVDLVRGTELWRGDDEITKGSFDPQSGLLVSDPEGSAGSLALRSVKTGKVVRTVKVPKDLDVDAAIVAEGHLVLEGESDEGEEWVGLRVDDGRKEWETPGRETRTSLGLFPRAGIVDATEGVRISFASGEQVELGLPDDWTLSEPLNEPGWWSVSRNGEHGVWHVDDDAVEVSSPGCGVDIDGDTLAQAGVVVDAVGREMDVVDVVHDGERSRIRIGPKGDHDLCITMVDGRLFYESGGERKVVDVDDLFD